nr:immunoglobulin light chain junction region [Macaca mulatta]
GQQYYSTPYSF